MKGEKKEEKTKVNPTMASAEMLEGLAGIIEEQLELDFPDMEDGGDPLEDRPLGVSSLSSTMKREKSLISLQ